MSWDPAKHLRGEHGHFAVEAAIAKAHSDLSSRFHGHVPLRAIREHQAVKGHPPEDVTAALRRMGRGDYGGTNLVKASNQQTLTAEDRRHEIVIGGDAAHLLTMDHQHPSVQRLHQGPSPVARGAAPVARGTAPVRTARQLMSPKPAAKAAPAKAPAAKQYTAGDLTLKTNDALRTILRSRGTTIPKGAGRAALEKLVLGR